MADDSDEYVLVPGDPSEPRVATTIQLVSDALDKIFPIIGRELVGMNDEQALNLIARLVAELRASAEATFGARDTRSAFSFYENLIAPEDAGLKLHKAYGRQDA